MACGPCGDALRWQGELRGILISPFAPLTPTPLKTSRDTLHPPLCRLRATSPLAGEKGGISRTISPCGARSGVRGCDGDDE